MSLSPEEIADIVQATDDGSVELRLFIAAAALFCFDYSVTLSREVEYIWKREFSTPTLLFYLVRYMGLITAVFAVMEVTGWTGISARSCSIVVHIVWVQNVTILSSAVVFSALRACALCQGDKRVFAVVMLLGCPNPAIAGYTYASLNFYTTSLAAGCGITPDMPDAVYENWIIGARSSALLTDMVVLVITIWKARLVQAPGVKLSVKFTVADSLMQDGVLYFGVLLFTNLVGLILVRVFILIQPLSTGTIVLTAIMTSRFILDLREAADPRFNGPSTGGGNSTLIFPVTSTHAPCFDSDLSSGTSTSGADCPDPSSEDGRNTAEVADRDDAELQARRDQMCSTAGADGRGLVGSRCDDVELVIWIR